MSIGIPSPRHGPMMCRQSGPYAKQLCFHHVGGREGDTGIPPLPRFARDIVHVLYDADPDCLEQIRSRNPNGPSQLVVLPYCLASQSASASFNISYDPVASSLYDPNPRYGSYYFYLRAYDWIFAETFKPMQRRAVQTVTLDTLVGGKDRSFPAPDFLSLDTQGSEYDILVGADKTLRSTVLGVLTEVEFHPLYKGQKLYGDVVNLLAGRGFDFVRFFFMQQAAPYRYPVGLRGDGYYVASDALFLRRIDDVLACAPDEQTCAAMLAKLAFIAIVFNQFEYGLECLHQGKRFQREANGPEPTYAEFLRRLEEAVQETSGDLRPTFASTYTFEQSVARFSAAADGKPPPDGFASLKESIKRVPLLGPLSRAAAHALRRARGAAGGLARSITGASGPSPVERVLIEYGLTDQAALLRTKKPLDAR